MRSESERYCGIVVEQLPDALFTIRLDESNRRVVAHVDGSPRRNFVRLLPGDRVTVELTAQNRTRGRITGRTDPVTH
jgi:translation initiation factor IF-1